MRHYMTARETMPVSPGTDSITPRAHEGVHTARRLTRTSQNAEATAVRLSFLQPTSSIASECPQTAVDAPSMLHRHLVALVKGSQVYVPCQH